MIFKATNVWLAGPDLCLNFVPDFVHRDLVAALVCGRDLPAGEAKQMFLDTGLIHLMVVSGAHLIFLESLLGMAGPRSRLSVLAFYCWFTGFGPPIVKAFMHRAGEYALRGSGWSPLWIEALAIFLTLCASPWWLFSRSLQMSWMCFLALSLPPVLPFKPLDQSVKTYALLYLFAGASWISVGWNTLIAPFVGALLFPLSLALLPLPFLMGPVAQVWDLFLALLRVGPHADPAPWFLPSRDLLWVPLGLHAALLFREVRWRRARAFSR